MWEERCYQLPLYGKELYGTLSKCGTLAEFLPRCLEQRESFVQFLLEVSQSCQALVPPLPALSQGLQWVQGFHLC